MARTRTVLGAMTGTSIDGIDMVLARIDGEGGAITARLLGHTSGELGGLGARLRDLAEQRAHTAHEFAEVSHEFGALHARVAADFCARMRVQPDLACVHGQTILHRPPLSWQLMNPWPLARALRCPVVFDLRSADLAEEGQGAPLTPLSDWFLYRSAEPRAIINLGGFANASYLPACPAGGSDDALAATADIRGGDLCACNQLLDKGARAVLNASMDEGGLVALSGEPNGAARAELVDRLQPAKGRQSLGTGDESWEWLEAWRAKLDAPALLATLADGIGTCIGRAIAAATPRPARVVVAGGGAYHARLVRAIESACALPVQRSDELGIPSSQREALGWAVLGALAQDKCCVTLPAITVRARRTLADGLWCFPVQDSTSTRGF